MNYSVNDNFIRKLRKIKKKQPELLSRIEKQLNLFESNENHLSLRNHKLKGEMNEMWSISVGMDFRLIYFIENGEAYFFDCGSHDEVYR